MKGSLPELQQIGSERIRILAHDQDAPPSRALRAWLSDRPEVLHVTPTHAGAMDVRFKDSEGAAGAFARSLKDRIFMIHRPLADTLSVSVVHSLSGRARLRVTGANDEKIERLAAWLATLQGIVRASPSPPSQSILVQFEPHATSVASIVAAVRASDPNEWPEVSQSPRPTGWRTATLNTVVLAATASGLAPPSAVAAAVALTAIPSGRRALQALREGRLSVDVLDLAAIAISLGTGQAVTAALITWLLGIGDLVLERTGDRARSAISKLMDLEATEAFRIRGDHVERVSVKRITVGDRLVVEAGGRIAADGFVASGLAMVDEKALTGESFPREKRPGDRVLAATVVVEGQLVVEVERTGADTTAMKIVQILEGAGKKPMTLQRDTERVADRLVLPTFGIAGAAALFASQIDRMTSVLITDFGTGIRITVPTSALTAMTVAARAGVLVKGGQYLERLAKVDVVVFDKTGTLTTGEPRIVDVVEVGSLGTRDSISFASSAEARQAHPIAKSIHHHAARLGVDVPDAELGSETYTIGIGLAARVLGRHVLVGGKRLMLQHGVRIAHARAVAERHRERGASSVFIAVDGNLELVLGLADDPREESRDVVRALAASGRRRVILLSGDAKGPVAAVGQAVGVDEAVGELLPEDKARFIRELQRGGKIVAMIGDGINDAPALAVADVGISLDGGTDVALETADVVLLDGGLAKLPFAFDAADRAMAHVRRGLGLVIVPNALAIVAGALGLISPGVAAAINNGSTVVAALAAVAPLVRVRRR